MANAVANFKTVKRTVEDKKRDGVVLTLSQTEAEVLFAIVGNVGGPLSELRAASDDVYDALYTAGVRRPYGIVVAGVTTINNPGSVFATASPNAFTLR